MSFSRSACEMTRFGSTPSSRTICCTLSFVKTRLPATVEPEVRPPLSTPMAHLVATAGPASITGTTARVIVDPPGTTGTASIFDQAIQALAGSMSCRPPTPSEPTLTIISL